MPLYTLLKSTKAPGVRSSTTCPPRSRRLSVHMLPCKLSTRRPRSTSFAACVSDLGGHRVTFGNCPGHPTPVRRSPIRPASCMLRVGAPLTAFALASISVLSRFVRRKNGLSPLFRSRCGLQGFNGARHRSDEGSLNKSVIKHQEKVSFPCDVSSVRVTFTNACSETSLDVGKSHVSAVFCTAFFSEELREVASQEKSFSECPKYQPLRLP